MLGFEGVIFCLGIGILFTHLFIYFLRDVRIANGSSGQEKWKISNPYIFNNVKFPLPKLEILPSVFPLYIFKNVFQPLGTAVDVITMSVFPLLIQGFCFQANFMWAFRKGKGLAA